MAALLVVGSVMGGSLGLGLAFTAEAGLPGLFLGWLSGSGLAGTTVVALRVRASCAGD